MTKVLIAVTSYNETFYADGAKTGLFAIEAIHPFEAFKAKGFEVDFVSETGQFGYDDHSLTEDSLKGDAKAIFLDRHSDYNVNLSKIKAAKDVDATDYSIFFAAGGHGTVYDFPEARELATVAKKIYNQGGVIAAVCHGPVIFGALESLVKGKNVTGFADEGEKILGVEKKLAEDKRETPKDIAIRIGAHYREPPSVWGEFVVEDSKIITGVNPASAEATAKAAIAALS